MYKGTFTYLFHDSPGANLGDCSSNDNFSWVPNCSLGTPRCETRPSLNINLFGIYENIWFLWQPIVDLRMGVCLQNYIIHNSVVPYPVLLNLVTN